MANVPNTPTGIIGAENVARLRAAGFEIVPREPTQAMLSATDDPVNCDGSLEQAWRAMIDAALEEPSDG